MRPVEPGMDRAVEGSQDPSFLIVGTARSGTTLVQRLACSLEGVRVPPETHFRAFTKALLQRESFPLDEPRLRAALVAFSERKVSEGLEIDVDAIVADLGGTCPDPWRLFAAIVRDLAGPAAVVGEKTPEHLRWWKPMTRHFPSLRLLAIVREPRAVVASNLQVPFGPRSHYLLAERWRTDQRQLRQARAGLPPERCRVVRYEDLVAEPARYRAEIGDFLGVDPSREAPVDTSNMRMEWEWWKERADAPITTDRLEAWRDVLSASQARDVLAICRSTMGAFGYTERPAAIAGAGRTATFPPRVQRARLGYRRTIRRELSWVEAL